MTKYELSLTKDYASGWTLVDAIRELFQNALDQETVNNDNPMFWSYEDGIFKVGNAKSVLKTKSLLLGASTKSDDDETIGKFGEGYKIATLVLIRLGKKVKFYNYGAKELWTADISYSKKYEEHILVFNVDKKFPWNKVPDNDLTMEVEGITYEEYLDIMDSNLHIQKEYKTIKTEYGEVLLDEKYKGKMYVNGLFINEVKNFHYGYNFKPKMIKLDRDRKLIEEFDLTLTTSKLWNNTNDVEALSIATRLVMEDVADTKYVKYTNNYTNELSDSVAKEFVKTYGRLAVPVSNQEEFKNVEKGKQAIIIPENVASVIKKSNVIKYVEPIKVKTLSEKVEEWLDFYGGNIKREAKRELIKILKEEKNKEDIPF